MCDFSWAVIVEGVANMTIASAGLYSWFDNYVQPCVDTQNCQQRLFLNNGGNEGFRLFNLITIGSVEMLSVPGEDLVIYAKDNTQARSHPFWSILAGYLDDGANNQILECTDDDTSDACNATPLCDYSATYDTLDAVLAASGSFSPACADLYALRALQTMLQVSVDQFASTDNGYDDAYGYYVEAVKAFVPSGLAQFMSDTGAGNQYFTCSFHVENVPKAGTTTHKCPITAKERGFNPSYTITYTLDDENGFFNALQSQLGIQKEWVKFDTQYTPLPCTTPGTFCTTGGISLKNYPMAAGSIDVSNPKDTVTAAMTNITATQDTMWAREMDIMSAQWYGSTNDIVQVVSMPVLMLQQALDAMDKAKALGKKQQAADKKNLIIEILSVILIFIPFLDEIAPEALAAARIGTLIGDSGSLALTLQDIVSDPNSAPLAILGILGGAGATLADVGNMAKLATARRGISDDTISGIGPVFKALNDDLKSINKPACKL
jgi:glucan 1,3-beta-glucosidase